MQSKGKKTRTRTKKKPSAKKKKVVRASRAIPNPLDSPVLDARDARAIERQLFQEPSRTSPTWEFDGGQGGQTVMLDPAMGGRDAINQSNLAVMVNRMEKQMYFMVSKYKELLRMQQETTSKINVFLDNLTPGMRVR